MLNLSDMPYKLGNQQEALSSKNTALMISTYYGRIVPSSPNRLLLP